MQIEAANIIWDVGIIIFNQEKVPRYNDEPTS